MFWRKKSKDGNYSDKKVNVTVEEVEWAVEKFAESLRQGVSLRTLINKDHTINGELLAPFLKGIPIQSFYMSKETFELFEERDKEIAIWIDKVQQAVDRYINQEEKLPIIKDDPYKKVNMLMLKQKGYLDEDAPFSFFLTNEENMVSYEKVNS
jgi:hypothetical protein